MAKWISFFKYKKRINYAESVGKTKQNWCQPKIIAVLTLNFDVALMLIKWHCFSVEIQLSL